MHTIKTRSLLKTDWARVTQIYTEGIETQIATFETNIPTWEKWNNKNDPTCRLVAEINKHIVGFIAISKISNRNVYSGVAEVSLYVSKANRGQKVGETLLNELIRVSEKKGFWTLQANIFSQNKASIKLFEKCGFRIVGFREKIGKLNQNWHNNNLLERRSKLI